MEILDKQNKSIDKFTDCLLNGEIFNGHLKVLLINKLTLTIL